MGVDAEEALPAFVGMSEQSEQTGAVQRKRTEVGGFTTRLGDLFSGVGIRGCGVGGSTDARPASACAVRDAAPSDALVASYDGAK